eukprot:TRINITY_DN96607_c0_g1_i1.p1 TRINITY_DN96607_c0_g1~~TRINITY_DN96607_c0_g1_i1.p1  ORF type:complete len:287 (-),score=56.13 TRINITY_DN96607_c0_g1_i1:191-985(-)
MAAPKTGGSWADDDDFNDEEFLEGSPARIESEPDEQGVKTITDLVYRDGKKYKVTKKIRKVKKAIRINKHAEERKQNWKKFGKAKDNDATITEHEGEITFDLSGTSSKSLVDRRKINQELKELLLGAEKGQGAYQAPTSKTAASAAKAVDEKDSQPSKPGAYVAPGRRPGTQQGSSMGRDDAHTVRVSNLSQAINEQDLKDLFSNFGALQRVHLVKDRETWESKGFAFVSFHKKADAERAIKQVTGFGYDHLILQVEWARPPST